MVPFEVISISLTDSRKNFENSYLNSLEEFYKSIITYAAVSSTFVKAY